MYKSFTAEGLTDFERGEMFGEAWESSVEQARAIDDERVLVTGWIKVQGLGGGVHWHRGRQAYCESA